MNPTPSPGHILIVEDEPRLAQLVSDYLAAAGYTTQRLDNGLDVLPAVRQRAPDLLLLDLMLPGRDGLGVCRELRLTHTLPVIMLTARVEEVHRLLGLEIGADDYICKPFSPREVVARVAAVLRRHRLATPVAQDGSPTGTGPAAEHLVLDAARYQAHLGGRDLDLTPIEFRLLAALAGSPQRVFSRDQLLDKLHDDARALSDRTVDSHIKNLRRKLDAAAPGLDAIRSIYGVGYRFELSADLRPG